MDPKRIIDNNVAILNVLKNKHRPLLMPVEGAFIMCDKHPPPLISVEVLIPYDSLLSLIDIDIVGAHVERVAR